MASLNGQSPRSYLALAREHRDRLVRRITPRAPSARAAAVAALAVGMALAGRWAGTALVSTTTCYLDPDRPFSSEDLERARRALDAKGIAYRVVDRKIEVSSDQRAAAKAELAKLSLGPPSLDEVRSSHDWLRGVLNTTRDRDREERLSRERMVEIYINNLEGVIRSQVLIQSPFSTATRRERFRPSALVSLETAPDRPLPTRTVQAIPIILERVVPGLERDSITVLDRDGRAYVDPGDPALGVASHARAREEEIRKDLLEKLAYIRGVRVWVRIDEPARAPRERGEPLDPARSAGATESGLSALPVMGVNRPIELPVGTAGPSKGKTASAAATGLASLTAEDTRGHVLVNVPRSFYYDRMLPASAHHQPSKEDLHVVVERTREQVLRLVEMAVPPTWKVDVDTVPDEVAPEFSAGLPASPAGRRAMMDWGAAAAVVGATVLVAAAVVSWGRAARRPTRPGGAAAELPRRHRVDVGGEEPGPSERVRALVRRDPGAAASVLQRWASEGGSAT